MRFNRRKILMFLLDFNDNVPIFEHKIEGLPLLVDKDERVLLGNSLRKNFELTDHVDCIIIERDDYVLKPLEELETALVKDNEVHDVKRVAQGLKKYLSSFKEVEAMRLFDLPVEDRFITKENFKKPPDYNFDKGKKDKEVSIDAGLFGGS